MAVVLGLQAFTCINSGSTATPVWVEISNIKDETLNMDTALSDITTRAANGWRLQVGTLSEGTIDAGMIYDTEDTVGFVPIQTAFFAKTRVLMGFFDGDPNGSGNTYNGLIGGFSITNFTINRQLEEAMMVDTTFTAREDDAGSGPQWVTVTNA